MVFEIENEKTGGLRLKNIVYIHDHKFIYLNGGYYSDGKFTSEVFARYDVFNAEINVISRVIENNQFDKLNKITNTNIHFLPVKGVGFFSIFTKYLLNNIKMIVREIKKTDALIVRLPSFLGIFFLILNIFFRKKYFIEFVGDPYEALMTSKNNINIIFKIFIYLFAFSNRYFVKNADGVIYVTKYDLQKRYPTKKNQSYASNVEINVKSLHLSIDEYKFKNDTKIKIGMIGSINNEYKGIDAALKAIKLLKQQNCVVQLHILGSGKLKNYYLEMAKQLEVNNQIYFDGSLSGGDAVLNWLKELDLYIQPSRTEGLPRALIEAMSVGLPAVATKVGGIPELLPDEFLVPSNNSLELAEKIKMLIHSQQLRHEQGKANYEKAKEYDSQILRERRMQFWSQAKNIVEKDFK